MTRFQWRLRLLVVSLVLTAVAFIQVPGRTLFESKLDLVVDPWGFLSRSLTLWDDSSTFGRLQNQAYGYLFPMGPFFGIGHSLRLEPWVVQRLWWAVVLVVAFLGVVKLCSVLRIGTPHARIVAGLAFALSPRILSTIGPTSVEIWPTALAPWVLVPLAIGLRTGHTRRAALVSACVVGAIGGVNATATFAVVPLAALFLLAAERGPRRTSMLLWWPPLVFLTTAWWMVGLFALGAYSPPFLDYIEAADVATFPTGPLEVVRGVAHWVPYIDASSMAGRQLVEMPALVVATALVAAVGVAGLARRDVPYRRFMVVTLLVGLVMVGIGQSGPAAGPFAATFRELFDGPLAPLRGTHKFEVLVRLPLVLGLAHVVGVLATRAPTLRARRAVTVAMAVVVATAATPAWGGALANRGSFVKVPDYWTSAAEFLREDDSRQALVVPASEFGTYLWGTTADEPMQPLAERPWAVRNVVPMAPGGTTTMLDAISSQLATGRGGPELRAMLLRAGVTHVVLRNDLDQRRDVVSPELVTRALATTPGIEPAAAFGESLGGGSVLRTDDGDLTVINGGWQAKHGAIEIFRVSGDDEPDPTLGSIPTVVGSAVGLMRLEALGIGGTSVLAQDTEGTPSRVVLTDTIRKQEESFGLVNHNRSSTLTRDEPYTAERPVHRRDEAETDPYLAVAELEGARSITASSSQASVGVLPFIQISTGAWAAFDDDPGSAWQASRSAPGQRAWIELDLERPTNLGQIEITLGGTDLSTRRLTVTTDEGEQQVVGQAGLPIPVDVGRTQSLRISGPSSFNDPLSIADVSWEDRSLARPLRLAELPEDWPVPSVISLGADVGRTPGCLIVSGSTRCATQHQVDGEEEWSLDRVVPMSESADYDVSLRVRPHGGDDLDLALQRDRFVQVAATSTNVTSPQGSVANLTDGSIDTGWVAGSGDGRPAVSVRWTEPREVSTLRLDTVRSHPSSRPTEVDLTFDDGSTQTVEVEDGVARFDEVETAGVRIAFVASDPVYDLDYNGGIGRLPVGLSELSIDGVPGFGSPFSEETITSSCRTGPVVTIDGEEVRTRLRGSAAAIAAGELIEATPCDDEPVTLGRGDVRVTAGDGGAWRVEDVTFTSVDEPADVAGGPTVESTSHNFNRGWTATTDDGEALEPIVLDGWRQGWIKPRSTAEVTESYAPDEAYRIGLGVGALLVLVAVGMLVLGWGRRHTAPDVVRPSGRGRWLSVVQAGLVAVLVGWAALLAAAVGAVACWWLRRSRGHTYAWVPAVFLALAGVVGAFFPWGGSRTWSGDLLVPQLLVMVAIGWLVPVVRARAQR